MLTNLYDALLARPTAEEQISKIARLVRTAHRAHRLCWSCEPTGFWYDQPALELVAVPSGEARLHFADENAARTLMAGDFIHIPAHLKHGVEWTPP